MSKLFLFLTSPSSRLPSSSPSSSPLPATVVDDDEANLSSKYLSASLNIFFLAPIGSSLYATTNLERLFSSVSSLVVVVVLLRAFNIVVALKMSRFNAFVDCTCTLVHSSSFFIRVSSANVPGPSSFSESIIVFERNASTFSSSSSSSGRAMHRTFESSSSESSSSKKPHPSSSLNDDDDGEDFKRLLRLSLFREEDEVNEEGKGARRRGAQRRILRDDDDVTTPRVKRLFSFPPTVFQTPKVGL